MNAKVLRCLLYVIRILQVHLSYQDPFKCNEPSQFLNLYYSHPCTQSSSKCSSFPCKHDNFFCRAYFSLFHPFYFIFLFERRMLLYSTASLHRCHRYILCTYIYGPVGQHYGSYSILIVLCVFCRILYYAFLLVLSKYSTYKFTI